MTKIENEQAESNKSLEGKAPVDEQPFGAMLKAAREEAGYSIERAAMATRITQPFVEALEQGNFEELPGAVFGRGFIRNLCKAYGKDSAEILAAFDRHTNAGKGKDVNLSVRDEKRHQQLKKGVLLIQPNEWKGRIKALAPHHYLRAKPLVILVGVVIVAGIIINQFDSSEPETRDQLVSDQGRAKENVETPTIADQTPPAGTSATAAVQTAAAPVTTPPASVPAAAVALTAPAPTVPVSTPAPAANAPEEKMEGGTLVELRVKETVVVKITKDAEKQVVGELKPDTYYYRFKNQLKFYVEDASVVEIYFNNQRVPTTTVKGESKRISFQSAESQIATKKASPSHL